MHVTLLDLSAEPLPEKLDILPIGDLAEGAFVVMVLLFAEQVMKDGLIVGDSLLDRKVLKQRQIAVLAEDYTDGYILGRCIKETAEPFNSVYRVHKLQARHSSLFVCLPRVW